MRDPSITSRTMRAVKGKNTKPELALRRALHSNGLRYRLHRTDLPGKPDIVFTKAKIAIFVDGDFWHGNQWKQRGFTSVQEQFANKENADYWINKITRNSERDRLVTEQLEQRGWKVLRFWESKLKSDLHACVTTVIKAIRNEMAQRASRKSTSSAPK